MKRYTVILKKNDKITVTNTRRIRKAFKIFDDACITRVEFIDHQPITHVNVDAAVIVDRKTLEICAEYGSNKDLASLVTRAFTALQPLYAIITKRGEKTCE